MMLTAFAIRYTDLQDTGGGLSGFAFFDCFIALSLAALPSLARGANTMAPVYSQYNIASHLQFVIVDFRF
jgi:hypothetical protein